MAFAGLVNPNPGLRALRGLQQRWELDDRGAWDPQSLRGQLAEAIQLQSPFPRLRSEGTAMTTVAPVLRRLLRRQLANVLPGFSGSVTLFDHHRCHAMATWSSSGFADGLVVVADGVGDGLALTVWRGHEGRLQQLDAWPFPHSHGLLYATLTAQLGFRPFRHEGKLAGLAAHGDPGAVSLPWPFAGPPERRRLEHPLGGALRRYLQPLSSCRREDVCAWLQEGLEGDLVGLVRHWCEQTGQRRLAVAGGVFANVRLNQKVAGEVEDLWVFPHMGDGGLAVGAAQLLAGSGETRPLAHAYLGGGLDPGAVDRAVEALAYPASRPTDLAAQVAAHLGRGDAVAVARGRAEFGPRALGHRSILASARFPEVSERLNAALSRSDFMPFAPALLASEAEDSVTGLSPVARAARFMTACVQARPVLAERCPAVVHRDGSLRPQVVHEDTGGLLHAVLVHHHRATGEPAVLNTSFNLHEEPIVQSAEDATRTFARSGLEVLVLGDWLVRRPGVKEATASGA